MTVPPCGARMVTSYVDTVQASLRVPCQLRFGHEGPHRFKLAAEVEE